ncbi:hypothetical protein O6H91_08G020200 [Diphasiastrum complanatum]|uniref:Uncharacterized protein n=1 Tax=Diphasiastrum complanatum TaxID=34168 RepID=A0ACC2CVG8_DIPCM|nr:hypothetical protein O6H91_08G020200 [Diphasiastrum complanatum]
MEETLQQLQVKDTKERMAGVERLQVLLEQSRKVLSASDVANIVEATKGLLNDSNFRVCQGALQALESAAALAGEHLKMHFTTLIPAVVECLGDSKQPVRDAGRRLLLALMEISSPSIVVERAGSYAWMHKNWRVREEFARTAASSVSLFAATEIPLQRLLLPSILQLLEDSNSNVRDAAVLCLQEMYRRGESQLRDELERHSPQPEYLEVILAKLAKGESKIMPLDVVSRQHSLQETRSQQNLTRGNRKGSPKAKPSMMEVPAFGGDIEAMEKPVDPIAVYSEKELSREIERIAGTLAPEQDWSVRMAAMRRMEALVAGGASDYASFAVLLRQLVGPLSVQLGDRRSSIVKQACHLLSTLSRELLADFEPCAESFIPVLLKLVIITVQMLRNCRVARLIPRIVDISKNDRNGVLRARCCEYALLVLELWADSPEIQRSAELFEDMIRCCVADAMSEVRATARSCYRLFAKSWPERSQRLFASFDPVIQRLINDEDRGFHKRYASPFARDRVANGSRQSPLNATKDSKHIGASSFIVPPIVAMDRRASLSSGLEAAKAAAAVQENETPDPVRDRYLEGLLQSSQQRANAIENILRGVDSLNKGALPRTSLSGLSQSAGGSQHSGVDLPSSRDPPHPASSPSSKMDDFAATSLMEQAVVSSSRIGSKSMPFGSVTKSSLQLHTSLGSQKRASLDGLHFYSHLSSVGAHDMPYVKDRVSKSWSGVEDSVLRDSDRLRRYESQMGQPVADNAYSNMPGFQRPLLRVSGPGRSLVTNRNLMEENPLRFAEVSNGYHGSVSLSDVLVEGLSANSNWSTRVAAFNFLVKLIQTGPKGLLEITQNFDKVMKLFCKYLDDPHHKVAQAALKALSEIVPNSRKPFEAYLERILPHIFSRLVDPKEVIRQLGTTALEIISKTYSVESLLPALLRSLDEQRSLKAKIAIIEFANTAVAKLAAAPESSGGSPLMRLWLAKLVPLASDKNQKLKEISVTGIIGIYSHYDSTAVVNFILDLGIDDQNSLRRVLKHYTPRIEVDVISHLQSKHQRSFSKSTSDQVNSVPTMWDASYGGRFSAARNQSTESYSSESVNSENSKKLGANQCDPITFEGQIVGDNIQNKSLYHQEHRIGTSVNLEHSKGYESLSNEMHDIDSHVRGQGNRTFMRSTSRQPSSEVREGQLNPDLLLSESTYDHNMEKNASVQDAHLSGETLTHASRDSDLNVPALLHQMSKGADEVFKHEKTEALHKFMEMSHANASGWCQYFNQILTAILETLDDPSQVNKELALSVIHEMLNNQKDNMEDSVEVVLERLLHISKDSDTKVKNAADQCLNTVLTRFDPYRCLTVVVPLLSCEDEKTLVSCVSCLTKIVGHLSQEELMSRLSSFLPALFEAFNSQNADVRKTVVFCLVDIYLLLGKAFVPHLTSLTSTQLRLVTIYANRISQARTGNSIT